MTEITIEDKIAHVEQIIESVRWARSEPEEPAHRTYVVMKAVASDLRGQLSRAPGTALMALEFQVHAAARVKSDIGHIPLTSHQAVSECVISWWPVIRRALSDQGGKT
jgi:hypothetical protein